jgi:hypothetical protein
VKTEKHKKKFLAFISLDSNISKEISSSLFSKEGKKRFFFSFILTLAVLFFG